MLKTISQYQLICTACSDTTMIFEGMWEEITYLLVNENNGSLSLGSGCAIRGDQCNHSSFSNGTGEKTQVQCACLGCAINSAQSCWVGGNHQWDQLVEEVSSRQLSWVISPRCWYVRQTPVWEGKGLFSEQLIVPKRPEGLCISLLCSQARETENLEQQRHSRVCGERQPARARGQTWVMLPADGGMDGQMDRHSTSS